jgi:hypothetical protein
MTTRDKILRTPGLARVLDGKPAILVIGSFDPLLALHAKRLADLSIQNEAKLVIAVTDPMNTVLSLGARQEMVAALDVVDFVVPHESGIQSAIPWQAIHDDTALHDLWTVDFKQHVRRRSQAMSV